MKDTLIRFLLAWSLVATCLLFMQREAQKPLLVYHADSKYAIAGKVESSVVLGECYQVSTAIPKEKRS